MVLQKCAQRGSSFPLSHIVYTGRMYRQTLNSYSNVRCLNKALFYTSPTRIPSHTIPMQLVQRTQVSQETNCEMQQLNAISIIQQSFLILPFVLLCPKDDENIYI